MCSCRILIHVSVKATLGGTRGTNYFCLYAGIGPQYTVIPCKQQTPCLHVSLMFIQFLRRWPNIKPVQGQHRVVHWYL